MSTVLVTGGSGTLGRLVVQHLEEAGHEVRVLSRRAGGGTHVGDLNSGEGLAAAASGAELVVHAASETRRFGRHDVEQTRRLVEACAGAEHLLYISIVGIDSIPYGYYERKLACEAVVATSGIPWTVLRATQFHELLAMLLQAVGRLPLAALPLDFRFQSVAAVEVAAKMVELVSGPPAGRVPDFGGPEVLTLGEMAEVWRARTGRPRRLLRLPIGGRVGRGFREGRNTCPEHRDGDETWARFVEQQ